jgi:hypothetical protein
MAGLTHCMIGDDPRDQCVEWFRQHVPPGTRVAFASDQWFSRPPLSPSIGYGPGEAQWVQGITGGQAKEVPYVLIPLSPPNWNLERLQSEQPDWVLMSEFEFGDAERLNLPEYRRFMEAVRRDYPVEKRFMRQPFLFPKAGLPPHDLMYLYPEIRIYGRDESTR